MTAPSLTYGHGKLEDCITAYTTRGDSADALTAPTCTTPVSGVFRIQGTTDNVAALEWCYYQSADLSGLAMSTSIYDKWLLRFRTSKSDDDKDGLGAKVSIVYTDDVEEVLYGSTPEYSDTWKLVSGTIAAAKTLKYIRFYVAEDLLDNTNGTYWVEYDFLLLHKGTFTFPFVDDVDLTFENRYADIQIPGRLGDITQYLGGPSPTIRLTGKIDIGTSSSWGVPALEYLYRIWQEAHSDPWQWFSTGGLSDADRTINCKVTLRRFPFVENKEASRTWSLELKQYSLSSGSEGTWANLQWIGI